ncbi:MAG: hypothetical protein F6K17_29055 [Okeania sp. SIO3C4]|nr:hypothetical protein [Okeania sp. SIO3C4]
MVDVKWKFFSSTRVIKSKVSRGEWHSPLQESYHVLLNSYTLEKGRQRAEGRRQKGILVQRDKVFYN